VRELKTPFFTDTAAAKGLAAPPLSFLRAPWPSRRSAPAASAPSHGHDGGEGARRPTACLHAFPRTTAAAKGLAALPHVATPSHGHERRPGVWPPYRTIATPFPRARAAARGLAALPNDCDAVSTGTSGGQGLATLPDDGDAASTGTSGGQGLATLPDDGDAASTGTTAARGLATLPNDGDAVFACTSGGQGSGSPTRRWRRLPTGILPSLLSFLSLPSLSLSSLKSLISQPISIPPIPHISISLIPKIHSPEAAIAHPSYGHLCRADARPASHFTNFNQTGNIFLQFSAKVAIKLSQFRIDRRENCCSSVGPRYHPCPR